MKIWCFNDAHNWGLQLAKKAQDLGHDAHLFDDPSEPDIGYVFFHMHHHPQTRIFHKRAMAVMALNPQLILIPDYRSSVLYDDKLEQARQLSRWTPRTRIFYAPGRARSFVDRNPQYPFISKSSEGASSNNVRLVRNADEARLEIKRAFSDIGIKMHYENQKQQGYLLWQDFVNGAPGDVRILAIGRKRLILKRGNRPDRPMASGSGKLLQIKEMTPELEGALDVANHFFDAENFRWCGIDLIYDKLQARWFILETTVGWNMPGYYECAFFDEVGQPIGKTGLDVWEVLLDEIKAGVFV